jgi:hypothetical protein
MSWLATTHDPEIMAELKELAGQLRELGEARPVALLGQDDTAETS